MSHETISTNAAREAGQDEILNLRHLLRGQDGRNPTLRRMIEEKIAALENASAWTTAQKETIIKIEKDYGNTIFTSLAYGEVEVWNFILCNRQNAEVDKVGEVERMECVLCDESEEVAKFFRNHGFKF